MKRQVKQLLRGVADRVLLPYFDRQRIDLVTAVAAASTTGDGPPSADDRPDVESAPGQEASGHAYPLVLTDFNHLLHELRTVELGRMVRADRVLLSVGCSDRSYFDWIERAHGPVAEHWGVELYRPQPSELPENVRWIVASASHMPSIADGSVDVVFSGQNFEHLSTDDLVGFLIETHRVLRPGGHLVIDSPNRLATSALHWRHPEHVVETSPSEAGALLDLAGFDVDSCRGQWLCIDEDSSVLPLMPAPEDAAEFLRRAVLATTAPERSFCWWIEASRSERTVDVDALRAHAEALIGRLWPERVTRGAFRAPAGTIGMVYRTGPFPCFGGSVEAQVRDGIAEVAGGPLWSQLVDDGGTVIARGDVELSHPVDQTMFGLWLELHTSAPLGAQLPEDAVEISLP